MTVWSAKFLQFACLLLLQMTCQALAAGGGLDEQGNVDLQASRVYVFVGKTGLGHDHGVEGRLKSGQVTLGCGSCRSS
ncbi:MAG UNVERIFIED_CONTAM: hypothetical protein LVR18_45365 [Planctomycetaceae bacterium]|jgi:hypothetical protein